jgi:DNA polymerase I-like protein with 3'-5' exonuclease and polymerase domains
VILQPTGFKYSGLTVVVDRQSRFDKGRELLTGIAGEYFNTCLTAGGNKFIHRQSVEIRTVDDIGIPFQDGTKCVLLMGEGCVQYYFGDRSLNEQRGAPFVRDGIPHILTYSPQDAYDRRAYFTDEDEEGEEQEDRDQEKSTHGRTKRKNWRFWMRQDIKKSVRVATSGLHVVEPNYHYYPRLERIVELLLQRKGGLLYFDIETDRQLQMTCFGFAFDDKDVYVVPMLQTHENPRRYFYDEKGTAQILRALSVALRDNTVVIHNSMFDLFVLVWRYGLPIGWRVYDTMLAHNRCYIEVEKSLGHVISLHTDLPYHKNEGIFEPHNYDQARQLYEYNGKDVFSLTQIKPKIDQTAALLGATESIEQVNRMVPAYLLAMLQGMRYREDVAKQIADNYSRKNIQLLRVLKYVTGQQLNPNSWQQVSKYLYDGLRLKKPAKDPTNEKSLLQLLLKDDVAAINCILQYRQNNKKISKSLLKSKKEVVPRYYFGLFGTTSTEPRFTCSYALGRTVTMRLGSSKLLSKFGDNSQNFDYELRKVIGPDKGKIFIQPDQSGAEALIVAYLCKPGNLRDLFLCGINPHCFLGLHLFREQFEAELGFSLMDYVLAPVKLLPTLPRYKEIFKCIKASDDWTPERRYYFIAKQGNHSLNYDAKARAFRVNTLSKSDGSVNLTLRESDTVISKRMMLFPELQYWHSETVTTVKKTGLLRNLFGHPRVITGWQDESQYKEWYAFVPQSTVGQITNYAFCELQERLRDGDKLLTDAGVDVVQNNHDSLLVQCYPEAKSLVVGELNKHMCRRLVNTRGEEFFMKSEAKWSERSWGEMEAL